MPQFKMYKQNAIKIAIFLKKVIFKANNVKFAPKKQNVSINKFKLIKEL